MFYAKVVLTSFANSQEFVCARVSFLIKLQAKFIKKKLQHKCFSVSLANFLRVPVLKNTTGRQRQL